MDEDEVRRQKAKALRYQRPIAKDLNFHQINEELWEIQSECNDVSWMVEDDDILDSVFDGDTEQAFEFRLMFSDLATDCGRMRNDLNAVEVWDEYAEDAGDQPDPDDEPSDYVPNIFDVFFPAIAGEDDPLLGFDTWEGDYYGLEWWAGKAARKAARTKVTRLTKDQLLDAAGQCLRIARQYLAIKYRYQCLKAALDILRAEEQTMLKTVQAIEAAYDAAEKASDGFRYKYAGPVTELDRLLAELPDRVWIE